MGYVEEWSLWRLDTAMAVGRRPSTRVGQGLAKRRGLPQVVG
ncbi:MAG: hypothetical protein Q8R91_01085 [Candidatus Omnitrophota bacterium]|nr:hypothetical protein [Candidatus Omnitrophota bacterium]